MRGIRRAVLSPSFIRPLLVTCLTLCIYTDGSSHAAGIQNSVWDRMQASLSVPSDARHPVFTEDVANQTVVIGRNGTLRCSVENLGTYKIAWMKADTQTLLSISSTMISRNYRIRVSHSDNSTWLLHLDFVTLKDRGYYLCQINTIPPISKQGYLEVVVPPNILDEQTSTDVEVSEDGQAELRCGATGYPGPEVRFRREDGNGIRYASNGLHGAIASSETENVGGVMQTLGTLRFPSVTRADMGHYLCIANNSVPPSVSKRMVLNVRYREPAVYVSHQMIGVYRGDDVAINCTVTAYPRPVVFWQDFTGKMIITGGRYKVVETQIGDSPPRIQTTLVIRNLEEEDISTYRCNASIDNDKNREKSLSVQLSEISRPSTESSLSIDVYMKARPPKTPKKTSPPHTRLNDIGERPSKPTIFPHVKGMFPPSHGSANYDESTQASVSRVSQSSNTVLGLLLGLVSLQCLLRGGL